MSDGIGVPGIVGAVEVGRGGFAVVYRATEPASSRTVAVKVLKVSADTDGVDRFQREVVAMGALGEHPAIVPLFRTGTTEGGQPYLVMPYFTGGSLQDELDAGTRSTWRQAATIGIRLAGALQAAHDEGILHRDLKPANVLRNRYGDVLLSDFGIARIAGGHETTTGVVTASIAHAAPEILDGARPSVASDVYGLASTLYALVQGRAAFVRDTDESLLPVISRVLTAPVPSMGTGNPSFEAALAKGMTKRPEDRHADAATLALALQQALDGMGGIPADHEDAAAAGHTLLWPPTPAGDAGANPAAANSAAANPVVANPVAANSAAANPVAANPVAANTVAANPVAANTVPTLANTTAPTLDTDGRPAPTDPVPAPLSRAQLPDADRTFLVPRSTPPDLRGAPPARSRSPRLVLAGGAAALALLAVIAVLVVRSGGDDSEEPAADGSQAVAEEDDPGGGDDGLPSDVPLVGIDAGEVPAPDSVTEAVQGEFGGVVSAELATDSVLAVDVEVTEPGLLRVQTVSDGLDLVATIRDADGALVAGDDDSGLTESGDALIDLPVTETGPYRVLVNPLGDGTGSVEVRVDLVSITPLGEGATGELDGDGPPLVFSVDLDEVGGQVVRLDVADADASLRLLDASGFVVTDSSGVGDAGLSLPDSGGPALVVAGVAPGQSGPFELFLSDSDPVLDVLDRGDVEEDELPTLEEVTRTVDDVTAPQEIGEGDVLAFPYTGAAGFVGRVVVRSDDLDTVMAMYDADGTLLAADDDGALSSDSGLESMVDVVDLAEGDLTVLVRALDGSSTGTVTLLAAVAEPQGLSESTSGQIDGPESLSAYSLDVGPDHLSQVQIVADVQVDLRLLDEDGGRVVLEVEFGGDPSLDLTEITPGRYVLLVSGPDAGAFTIEVG